MLLHSFLKSWNWRSKSIINEALLTSKEPIIVNVQVKQRQWKLYIHFKHSLLSILSGWFQQALERFCLSNNFKGLKLFIKTSYSTGKRILDEQLDGWSPFSYILCHTNLFIDCWCVISCVFSFRKKILKWWSFGSKQVHKDCQMRRWLVFVCRNRHSFS